MQHAGTGGVADHIGLLSAVHIGAISTLRTQNHIHLYLVFGMDARLADEFACRRNMDASRSDDLVVQVDVAADVDTREADIGLYR